MPTKVCILTRVSKSSQSYERQIEDLTRECLRRNFIISRVFNEKISGKTKNENRKSWIELLHFIDENKDIKKVLIWELTRLGRTPLETLKAVQELNNRKVSLFIYNYQLETLSPDNKINPISQMLITILSEFARSELDLIEQRLSSGYKKYRASGGKVGRKKGSHLSNKQLLQKHADIVRLLKKKRSIREISKLIGKSTSTVLKVKKIMNIENNV